jgi:hypothetical protein
LNASELPERFVPDPSTIYRVFYLEEGKVRQLVGYPTLFASGEVLVRQINGKPDVVVSAVTKYEIFHEDGRTP